MTVPVQQVPVEEVTLDTPLSKIDGVFDSEADFWHRRNVDTLRQLQDLLARCEVEKLGGRKELDLSKELSVGQEAFGDKFEKLAMNTPVRTRSLERKVGKYPQGSEESNNPDVTQVAEPPVHMGWVRSFLHTLKPGN